MGPRRKRPRSRSIHAVSNRHEVLSSLFPSIRVIRCYLLREEIDDGYVPACVWSAVILDKRCSFRVSLWFVGSWIDVCYRRLWAIDRNLHSPTIGVNIFEKDHKVEDIGMNLKERVANWRMHRFHLCNLKKGQDLNLAPCWTVIL